jgi:predicted DNA-binding protein
VQAVKRTTVNLKPEIYRRLRRAAIDRDRTLQEMVNEALDRYLRERGKERKEGFSFRTFRLGKVRGRLTREEIYQDR